MKDFLGNELTIGDEVVFTNNCEELSLCFIQSFDYDETHKPISFVSVYNCWIYNDKLIKVIREFGNERQT